MRRTVLPVLLSLLLAAPASAQQVIISGQTGILTVDLSTTDRTTLGNIDTDLTTLIGHADGVEGFLSSITTAIQLLDNAAAQTPADNFANPTTGALAVWSLPAIWDGSAWDRWDGRVTDGGSTISIDDGGGIITVDGAISCSNCSGSGASEQDDSAFVVGTDSGAPLSGLFDNVSPDSVDEGDTGVVRMSANRNLFVSIRDAAGNERGLNIDSNGALAITSSTLSTAANQTTLIGHVDGVEGLLTTMDVDTGNIATSVAAIDTDATTIIGHVDGLEGSVDGLETLLTTQAGYLDGLETLLTTQAGYVDGLEAYLAAIETASEASQSLLDQIRTAMSTDATQGGTVIANGPQGMYEAKNQDGSALPNAVSEGQSVRAAGSLSGVGYVMVVNEDGSAVGSVDLSGSSLTSLQLIDNLVLAEDAVHSSGAPGVAFLAIRQDSQSDLCADGDYCIPTIDADGNLRVTMSAGSGGTALADDADFTAGTTSFTPLGGFYQSTVTNCTDGDACAAGITQKRAIKATLYTAAGAEIGEATGGSGTIDSNTGRITIATDDPVNDALVELADAIFADDAVFTLGTNSVLATGYIADEVSTDTVSEGDIGISRMTLDRKQVVADYAHADAGADGVKYTSVGSTEDEHAVKTSAGTLYSITVTNTNAAARYLRCEADTAANTAPGTDTPEIDLAIPGATTGSGFTATFPKGYKFTNGLTCWLVTGAADTDVAEVAANEIKVFYTVK